MVFALPQQSSLERQFDAIHRTSLGILRWDKDGSIIGQFLVGHLFDAGLIDGETAILTFDAFIILTETEIS